MREYFNLQKSEAETVENPHPPQQPIPMSHEIRDYMLGHLLVNQLLVGPALFATLNQWDHPIPEKILDFITNSLKMGENTPMIFPVAIILLPLTFAAIEIGIRKAAGKLGHKEDMLVHTPLPFIKTFERTFAFFAILLATALQIFNGFVNMKVQQGQTLTTAEKVVKNFYDTGIAAFYGQLVVAFLVFTAGQKIAIPAAQKVGEIAGAFVNTMAGCCKKSSEERPLLGDGTPSSSRSLNTNQPTDEHIEPSLK